VDEKPVVLHADVRPPRPMRPGRIARRDCEPHYAVRDLGADAGHYLELIGSKDGSFDVFNSRTNATKHYAAAH
jgi:hypothetical protein